MNNTLAIVKDNEWNSMLQVADALVQSGFLPQSIKNAQQAVAIILAGRELGIGPWQALQTINVIQGKPTVSPQLMLALINQSGQLEDIAIDGDDKGCIVMMKRKGRQPHTETFTIDDAAKLGLAGKDNYRKQAAIMLRWRAVAACARIVFPDVILGLYTPDEMGADVVTDDSGNMDVITVEPEPDALNVTPAAQRFRESYGGDRRVAADAAVDMDAGELDAGELDDEMLYLVSELVFQASGKTTSCVLKAQDSTRIVMFSSDAFRAAGVTDDEIKRWKSAGSWLFDTPIKVWAELMKNKTNDNFGWKVHRIDMQRQPMTETDRQFASI